MSKLVLSQKELDIIDKAPGKDFSEKVKNVIQYYDLMNKMMGGKES
jgi:hypothetical protein